jgi:hypothetical protein
MIEQATVSIKCSPELLEQFKTWSQPLQVRAEQFPDGEWTLVFRDVRSLNAWRTFYEIMNDLRDGE